MKLRIILYIILFFLFSTQNISARYRAYKIEIKDTISGEIFEIITSLSPEVYINYYEANRNFREISIVSTWMCWGDTSGYKPICPNPREEQEEL